MKVFLNGATGFIGSRVALSLKANGHDVIGLARSDASAKRMVEMGVSAIPGDVEDRAALNTGARETEATIFVPAVGTAETAATQYPLDSEDTFSDYEEITPLKALAGRCGSWKIRCGPRKTEGFGALSS